MLGLSRLRRLRLRAREVRTMCLAPRVAQSGERKFGAALQQASPRKERASSRLEGRDRGRDPPPEFELVQTGTGRKGHFLKKAEVTAFVIVEEDAPKEQSTFAEMGIDERFLAPLKAAGFKQLTPVQLAVIPAILSKGSCAIQSYTGSGKTLAYLLPILTKALHRARQEQNDTSLNRLEKGQLQALIVAPSQELAMQIVRMAETILPDADKKMVQQLIGGANIHRQMQALKTKPLVAVGTPGRLAELSRKGNLLSHRCPILVLDEVDQLNKGQFRSDMLRVTEHTGKKVDQRQTIVVSATLTPDFVRRLGHWAPDEGFTFVGSKAATDALPRQPTPSQTTVPRWGWGNKPTQATAEQPAVEHASISMPPSIRHGYVVTDDRHKLDNLRRAIHAMEAEKCLVFMNFARRTQDAANKLAARGMSVGALHGDKDKFDRARALREFRKGELRALVVSDVVARGLDVVDCDAVFNVELPTDAVHYAHRAGRTGRLGRVGWVISFVGRRELFVVEKFAAKLGIEIPQVEIRNGEVRLREKASMPK